MNSWDHALLRLEDIPQPTIAFVDGLAANGGCEMTLACTFRVGTRRAAFSCREIMTGSIPGAGATQRLPRIVGMAHASEMIMTGKTVDSKEARSSGLLQEIVKDAGEFRLWLERFSRPSRSALSAAKRAIIQGSRMTFAEGLRLERGIMENLIRTCDLGRSPPS
jgi:enoyl-CoA hydratase/carnithine racemase